MICVIADDLAGAAELGGVALRHGRSAEVQLAFDAGSGAEVLCVNTDTRSCDADEAARRVAQVAGCCRQVGITGVFKKVDSVLRGWVAAELSALLPVLGRERALLVPANPARGRVIRDGQYWIDGRPLHETDFARDPEHPVHSPSVLALLGTAGAEPVHLLPVGDRLPWRGILVAEAVCSADLAEWAGRLDAATLPAGAAEFFAAFLAGTGHPERGGGPAAAHSSASERALFVCGSTSSASRAFLHRSEAGGVPVLRMPSGLLDPDSPREPLVAQWAVAAVQALQKQARVVVAIDRPLQAAPGMPRRLSEALAAVVKRILEQEEVDNLLVEGGATAMALVQDLGWPRLVVEREFAPGVVGVRPAGRAGPLVVIKPGSYPWPEGVANPGDQVGDRPQGLREQRR